MMMGMEHDPPLSQNLLDVLQSYWQKLKAALPGNSLEDKYSYDAFLEHIRCSYCIMFQFVWVVIYTTMVKAGTCNCRNERCETLMSFVVADAGVMDADKRDFLFNNYLLNAFRRTAHCEKLLGMKEFLARLLREAE